MRYCDVFKCKRLATGLTQQDVAEMVGVSSATISKFEQGEDVTTVVFNGIRNAMDNYLNSLDKIDYLSAQIKSQVLMLDYQSERDQLKSLNYITMNIGRYGIELHKKVKEDEA